MQNQDYNKLKGLAKYINQLIDTGKWTALGENRQNTLRNALNKLAARVQRFVAKRKLTRVLGAAVMLLSVNASAQSFADPVEGAFGLAGVSYLTKPEFVDIDGDGDLDFFQTNYDAEGFLFQENIGTAEEPDFSELEINPFGLSPAAGLLMPVFGDLDNDGDFDILASTYEEGGALYFENTGTATDPAFGAGVAIPFGITAGYIIMDDLVDIDDDGDLDLFVSKYDDVTSEGKVFFLENTGTPEAAAFASGVVDAFGMTFSGADYFTFVDFADFDDDGDYDFMRTDMYGKIVYYHENVGEADAPDFDAGSGLISPFDIDALTGGDQYFFALSLADIDADGDFDLFISEYSSEGTYFYENRTIVVSIPDAIEWNDEIALFPNPAVDNITIQTALTSEAIQSIRIITIDGREVYQNTQLVNTISVADFETGIYLLEVTNNEGQQMMLKFIKE
ncbi:MAG: T9SS type A sorting domain-containing protein [Crocinitomix sp.]|nr:T9SS type A sorting domain-containing protein [Crocinitomix sp.]